MAAHYHYLSFPRGLRHKYPACIIKTTYVHEQVLFIVSSPAPPIFRFFKGVVLCACGKDCPTQTQVVLPFTLNKKFCALISQYCRRECSSSLGRSFRKISSTERLRRSLISVSGKELQPQIFVVQFKPGKKEVIRVHRAWLPIW